MLKVINAAQEHHALVFQDLFLTKSSRFKINLFANRQVILKIALSFDEIAYFCFSFRNLSFTSLQFSAQIYFFTAFNT